MALNFNKFVISALLVSLFTFSIILFQVNLAELNGSNSSLLDNDAINKTFNKLKTNLTTSGIQNVSQQEREVFEAEIPTLRFDIILESIVSVGKTIINSVVLVINVIFSSMFTILGFGTDDGLVIFATFSAIAIVTMIVLAWSLYKTGR